MSIKFIHTADWQIGRLFKEVHGDKGAALRMQRLETVEKIGSLATLNDVDFIIVAGDVFEMNSVSDETIRRTILAMRSFSGYWIMLPGNHDAALSESVWNRFERLLTQENIILATEPEVIELNHLNTTLLPAPLKRRHDVNDLTEWFDSTKTDADQFRIGIAHGSVENRLPASSEAKNPIADTRAETASLDYLALGDWHGTINIAPNTWYSGTPEVDRWRNNDAGNVLLVEIDSPRGKSTVKPLTTSYFNWQQYDAIIHNGDDVETIKHFIESLEKPSQVLLQLNLTGSIDLHTESVLNEHIKQWQAVLHFLIVRNDDLIVMASNDDIDALGTSGFLLDTINDLRRVSNQPDHQDNEFAKIAIAQLYRDLTNLSTT